MPEPTPGLHDGLIARIASGDREAFGELYRHYRADVYRFVVHMTGAPAQAEDMVQDVFVSVIGAAERYRPGQSGVLPWLLGIAGNHARRWRHRRMFLPLPSAGSDEHEGLMATTDPVGDLTRARRHAELLRALQALSPRYREVIVLCDLQEFSYDTAAAALGCAVGTVRSRLHRGRAKLASALGGIKSEMTSYDSNRRSTSRSRA